MITGLKLLRNVGQFDSVSVGLPLARTTLVYAENARGKTTLAAIFRSLAGGDPIPIAERHRFGAPSTPHVVIECDAGSPAVFEKNVWSRTLPNILVFDDRFVDDNVCSGLAVGSEHRQNLHEWILGAQGVALSRALQQAIDRVEVHSRNLRTKADAIPLAARMGISVDDLCALPKRDNIDAEIRDAERHRAAAQERSAISEMPLFDPIELPEIDVSVLSQLLARDLPALEAAAVARVHVHLSQIGHGAEAWIASGMQRIVVDLRKTERELCPFCAQDLAGSAVIEHYRGYFSVGYSGLKDDIADALAEFTRVHGDHAQLEFERAVRSTTERLQFWSKFAEVPKFNVDAPSISTAWGSARDAVVTKLQAKQNSPLEKISLSEADRKHIVEYERHRRVISLAAEAVERANETVAIVKERATGGDAQTIEADILRLRAMKARHQPGVAERCEEYLAEKAAKSAAEGVRDAARAALDSHRQAIFPAFQAAINIHLQRFNAGFRLDQVTSVNTRGGPSCTYNVLINNQPIAIAGASPVPGKPSFRNSLSAGDRNTLALAFFFASLDQDQDLANKIVIIDDPITSLDEHRSLTTVQEVRRLGLRAAQLIVLSHEKPFLCNIWEGIDPDLRSSLEVARQGAGSSIQAWDVTKDCITEYDRRHLLLRRYVDAATPNNREVAESLRPVLESFLRVAYPEWFTPGTLLGPFRNICEQFVGTSREILNQTDIIELRSLTEYANRFHHDTNPAWLTQQINDGELLDFVKRTLAFTRR